MNGRTVEERFAVVHARLEAARRRAATKTVTALRAAVHDEHAFWCSDAPVPAGPDFLVFVDSVAAAFELVARGADR